MNDAQRHQMSQDRALLCRFEPVIRYTKGEHFFPMAAERYVERCSLWVQRPNKLPLRILPDGELSLENLSHPRADGAGAVHYLQFVEPRYVTDITAEEIRESLLGGEERRERETFQTSRGRLARVGYVSRLVDALFSLSLLARGRVPGETAVQAAHAYSDIMEKQEEYCYYGRVVRQEGWVALQYWFFYAYNDWRSSFFGANDHESDWEMVYIYLYPNEKGDLHPEWVAYAMHDASGDDLRRRWDDPELEKVGEHPIIYAGAGSHASYFQAGEYMTEIELPFVTPLVNVLDVVQRVWDQGPLGQPGSSRWSDYKLLRVPFIDYARGDGVAIGADEEHHWSEPRLLEPTPEWVSKYRGLWGLFARDPFSGENAPAGPMYNRDGTVRQSWYAPLGWAGLDKVAPPDQRAKQIEQRQEAIRKRRTKILAEIREKQQQLHGLQVESSAMLGLPHLKEQRDMHERQIRVLSEELDDLKGVVANETAVSEALTNYASQTRRGERSPARAHLRRPHHPATDEEQLINRFAEAWAAISIGLVMVGFVGLALFLPDYLIVGLGILIALIVVIESTIRQSLTRLIRSITVALAVLSSLVLLYEFFWQITVLVVLAAGSFIIWENLQELRTRK